MNLQGMDFYTISLIYIILTIAFIGIFSYLIYFVMNNVIGLNLNYWVIFIFLIFILILISLLNYYFY